MTKTEERSVLHEYHEWLVSLVDPTGAMSRRYSELLWCLDEVDYRYRVELDQNRYLDGLKMREEFDEETDFRDNFGRKISVSESLSCKKCSVLECFVALFTRYSDTILTEPGDPSVAPELFYDALSTLGLLYFDDYKDNFDDIFVILDEFMDGKKCMFCVKKCKKNADL